MHPEEVLEHLKAKSNPRKAKNLDILHAVCKEQHERGSRDFSVATIGRLSAERGGPVKSTIHNATGDDFKGLIKAWADHTGGVLRKVKRVSEDPFAAVLEKITDPAVKAVMGAVLAKNKKLTGENNLLKASANLVIDRHSSAPARSENRVEVLPVTTGLIESEITALRHAISEDFLADEGWTADAQGRVLNGKGRAIYKVGYLTAIRKVLGLDLKSPLHRPAEVLNRIGEKDWGVK